MAVQVDPPIQLDPSMDSGHQLAFINQNFQSIANTLKTNSFKIYDTNTGNIQIPNSWANAAIQSATITHNLGYAPAHLVYVTIPSDMSGGFSFQSGTLTMLPTGYLAALGAGGSYIAYLQAVATSTTLTIQAINVSGSTATGLTTIGFNYKYYILTESAATS